MVLRNEKERVEGRVDRASTILMELCPTSQVDSGKSNFLVSHSRGTLADFSSIIVKAISWSHRVAHFN